MESPAETSTVAPGTPDEAVIDTNVLLDWLVFDDPSVTALAAAIRTGQVRWVATMAMLDELAHARAKPASRHRRLPDDALDTGVGRWCRIVATPPAYPAFACRDPDDQKFIDLALARRTRWLFSRDKALLVLARRAQGRGVVICRPQAWTGVGTGSRTGR